jgi:hypothetical protein
MVSIKGTVINIVNQAHTGSKSSLQKAIEAPKLCDLGLAASFLGSRSHGELLALDEQAIEVEKEQIVIL